MRAPGAIAGELRVVDAQHSNIKTQGQAASALGPAGARSSGHTVSRLSLIYSRSFASLRRPRPQKEKEERLQNLMQQFEQFVRDNDSKRAGMLKRASELAAENVALDDQISGLHDELEASGTG